jgi:phage regulator Rha-like protein
MTDLLRIDQVEGENVVDSRLIATELEIQHESFIANLKKHQVRLEEKFGVIRFEIVKPSQGSLGGRPESFAWLNENQATALIYLKILIELLN